MPETEHESIPARRVQGAASGGLLALLLAAPLAGGAHVFGDGNPDNGIEDDRRALLSLAADEHFPSGPLFGTGTVHCDGAVRGSALLLDVSESAPGLGGHFLATAAHILYDLDSGRPFGHCEFRYLGLGSVPGAQAPIDWRWVEAGGFDALADRSDAEFGRHDWAFAYLPPAGEDGGWMAGLPLLATGQAPLVDHVHLLAFDAERGAMSLTGPCRSVPSVAEDLGGGSWPGQWLDDCDSGLGASGGALIAEWGGRVHLLAIRSGSHWSPQRFPAESFPSGPPAGAQWDPAGITNYARGIDAELHRALERLVQRALDSSASDAASVASGETP